MGYRTETTNKRLAALMDRDNNLPSHPIVVK